MPYDPAKDAWLGTVPTDEITPVRLAAGQLAVLYPTDAHAPSHQPAWQWQSRRSLLIGGVGWQSRLSNNSST